MQRLSLVGAARQHHDQQRRGIVEGIIPSRRNLRIARQPPLPGDIRPGWPPRSNLGVRKLPRAGLDDKQHTSASGFSEPGAITACRGSFPGAAGYQLKQLQAATFSPPVPGACGCRQGQVRTLADVRVKRLPGPGAVRKTRRVLRGFPPSYRVRPFSAHAEARLFAEVRSPRQSPRHHSSPAGASRRPSRPASYHFFDGLSIGSIEPVFGVVSDGSGSKSATFGQLALARSRSRVSSGALPNTTGNGGIRWNKSLLGFDLCRGPRRQLSRFLGIQAGWSTTSRAQQDFGSRRAIGPAQLAEARSRRP